MSSSPPAPSSSLLVIAIDGPAASGKSSTAAAVARALGGVTAGAVHLDSGALYRGLTRVALDLATRDPYRIAQEAEQRGLELRLVGAGLVPFLDGEPAEGRIRDADVSLAVSEIAALAPLRDWVNRRLRAAVEPGRLLVVDGRDIGTVVFPEAAVKVFLTATPEARAERRLRQLGRPVKLDRVRREAAALAARDLADSRRPVAPLRQAEEATVVDTTDPAFEQQVARLGELARGSWPRRIGPDSFSGSA